MFKNGLHMQANRFSEIRKGTMDHNNYTFIYKKSINGL
jgi:hypothetical protein